MEGDKGAEGVLKAMVTEDQIFMEPKGKDAFRIKNLIRLLVSSNHDWVVPAGLEERRFFVVDVGDKHMQDHEYFQKIKDQMENGGYGALLHFLKNYDLKGINLRIFPQTEALRETKLKSMSPLQKFWFSKLEAGSLENYKDVWEGEVSCTKFRDEYYEFSGSIGSRYKGSETEIGIWLKKLVPELKKRRKMRKGKRINCYEFSSLEECRKHWDNITRDNFGWSKEGVALRTVTGEMSLLDLYDGEDE